MAGGSPGVSSNGADAAADNGVSSVEDVLVCLLSVVGIVFLMCCLGGNCGTNRPTTHFGTTLNNHGRRSQTPKKRSMTDKERRDVIEAALTTTVRVVSVEQVLLLLLVTGICQRLTFSFLAQKYKSGNLDGENGENRTTDAVPVCSVMKLNKENSEGTRDNVVENELSEMEHQCAICLTNYEEGDEISEATNGNCKHHFHFLCIAEWLMRKDDCPYCRQMVLTIPEPKHVEDDNDIGLSETVRSVETAESESSTMSPEEMPVDTDIEARLSETVRSLETAESESSTMTPEEMPVDTDIEAGLSETVRSLETESESSTRTRGEMPVDTDIEDGLASETMRSGETASVSSAMTREETPV